MAMYNKNRSTFIIMMTGIIVITGILVSAIAVASNQGQVQVTLDIASINELAIEGGNVTLTIDSATAGYEPNGALDYLSPCWLYWTTNESSKKITVSTSLATPKFSLYLTSQNVSGGTYLGATQLSTTAIDYISSISATTGSCDLQYLALATVAQGVGTDTHTAITFTLTDS